MPATPPEAWRRYAGAWTWDCTNCMRMGGDYATRGSAKWAGDRHVREAHGPDAHLYRRRLADAWAPLGNDSLAGKVRGRLVDNGISPADAAAMEDARLLAIDGIGAAALARIRGMRTGPQAAAQPRTATNAGPTQSDLANASRAQQRGAESHEGES